MHKGTQRSKIVHTRSEISEGCLVRDVQCAGHDGIPVLFESGRLLLEVLRIDIGHNQLATGPQASSACRAHSPEPYDDNDISHSFLPFPTRYRRAFAYPLPADVSDLLIVRVVSETRPNSLVSRP